MNASMTFNGASDEFGKDEILSTVFKAISSAGISHAILSGPLPGLEESSGDVDFAVDKRCRPKELLKVIHQALVGRGWRIVRVVQHETDAYSAALVGPAPKHENVALDWCTDFRRNGMDLLPSRFLLSGKAERGGYWLASENIRFAYVLAKSLEKKKQPGEYFPLLSRLASCSPQECLEASKLLLGKENSEKLSFCLRSGNLPGEETLDSWRVDLAHTHGFSLSIRLQELRRLVRRIANPTGLTVAFLGPDGVGKTTAIRSAAGHLQQIFRTVDVIHFRPHLVDKGSKEADSSQPHGQQARGRITSLLKLVFYYFDHLAGYLLGILPKKIRNGAVLFDRHFADVIIDPRRYRLRPIPWLPELLLRMLPPPDFVVCLSAEPSTIHRRKSELAEEEIARQIKALDSLSGRFRQFVFIDANAPASEVQSAMREAIYSYLATRCSSRWL